MKQDGVRLTRCPLICGGMESWITEDSELACIRDSPLDITMVASGSILPILPWIGWLILWILSSVYVVVDARNIIRYKLEEEVPPGTVFGNVLRDSNVRKTSASAEIYFGFLTPIDWNFAIEPRTGELSTTGRVDRESLPDCPNKETCEITLDITVQPIQYFQIIKITLEILDVNDNAPVFPEAELTHPILESAEPGSLFVIPTASDSDSPDFGVVRYELESHRNTFVLTSQKKLDGSVEVHLTIDRKLDRERRHHYKVKVVAYDGGDPAKEGRMNIQIPILDSNDNSPVFDQSVYDINIPENLSPGTSVLRVQATDPDLGQNGKIQYNFSIQTETLYGHILAINSDSGEIYVSGSVDREQVAVCNLVVTARDQGPNAIPSDTTVVVTITDANDNIPQIKVSTLGSTVPDVAFIPEDAQVGTFVAHVLVSDPDEGVNGQVNCTLSDYTFTLQKTYESEYQLVTFRTLDRESIPQYGLELVCSDKGQPPQRSVKRLTVTVTDVNDNAPEFTQPSYMTTVEENNFIGIRVLQTIATDRDDGPNGDIRYSLSQEAADIFEIDTHTGAIKTKARLDREQTQRIEFHVIAKDRGDPPQSSYKPVLINIVDVDDELPVFVRPMFQFRISETRPVGSEVGTVTATDNDVPPNNQFFYSFLNEELSPFFLNSKTGRITSQEVLDRERQDVYKLIVKATDKRSPAMSSTAIVNIIILDANDNPPMLIFPTPKNNSVSISNKVPKGSVITRIRAHDPDSHQNGKLQYFTKRGNEEGIFKLDANTGILRTNLLLLDINGVFPILIQVVDGGRVPYRVEQELRVIINSSLPYPPPKPRETHSPLRGRSFHYNVIVVVAVACGATVVVVSCIICVILVRKTKRRRRNHFEGKPNGPTESHRMLNKDQPEDTTVLQDRPRAEMAESMKKLLTSHSADWDKNSVEAELQGDSCLEITKVLSEMDDDSLPELLSHTKHRGLVMMQDDGCSSLGSTPPPPPLPLDEQEINDGDSDTTAEFSSVAASVGSSTTPEPEHTSKTLPSCVRANKGRMCFLSDEHLNTPRSKNYQYPPPPPPPPNRLRTFCPDGRLPESPQKHVLTRHLSDSPQRAGVLESPQRSCLIQEQQSLQRKGGKVVTWEPSYNGNHSNGSHDGATWQTTKTYSGNLGNVSLDSVLAGSPDDPWEQRPPVNAESIL